AAVRDRLPRTARAPRRRRAARARPRARRASRPRRAGRARRASFSDSARGVRSQPRRLNPRNAGFLVFFARSPARPRRADDLASIVLDQDAAGLRQEFSLGRRSEGNEEIGIVLGTL